MLAVVLNAKYKCLKNIYIPRLCCIIANINIYCLNFVCIPPYQLLHFLKSINIVYLKLKKTTKTPSQITLEFVLYN